MSTLKVNRIKVYFVKNFGKEIDVSDLKKKPQEEIMKNLMSRSLAAYSLTVSASATIEEAAASVTDGYDDNGLDAIYFDKSAKSLWLVQSKFIESGTGGIDNGEIEKYTKGVTRLINGEFNRFNSKIQDRQTEIMEALDDSGVKIHLLLAYTGKGLSSHNKVSIDDLLKKVNDTDELLIFTEFDIDKAYKGLETGVSSAPINEDIFISNWGHIEEPFKTYYGQVNGFDLGTLWGKYGRKLFTKNIRDFIGNSDANDQIVGTIKSEPPYFIYFNNGITVLCDSIKKKPHGGSDKGMGAFTCCGISIVNGAQTLGSIGSLINNDEVDLNKIKVFVRFISLEDSPEGFDKRLTIANNTQNKVDKKDFVSLDSEQARIKLELKLDGIDYHFKRSDEKIMADEKSYILEEVAFSLAALWENVDYSVIVKKESGKLWDDVTNAPYTDIFNSTVSALKITKAVRIYRFIAAKMKALADNSEGRERSIYKYGNTLVAHIIFQKMEKKLWADNAKGFDNYFNTTLNEDVENCIDSLLDSIKSEYPDSMIIYVLRNYTKCRRLKELMMS